MRAEAPGYAAKSNFYLPRAERAEEQEEEEETVTAPLTDWRRRRLWNTNTTAGGQQADASPSQDGAPFGRMQIRPQTATTTTTTPGRKLIK